MTIEPIPHNVEKQTLVGRQRLRWTDNIESVPNQISVPSYELAKTAPLAISSQLFHSKLKTPLFNKSYPDS